MFIKTLKYDFVFSRGKFLGMAAIMILIAIGLRLNEQPSRSIGGTGGAEGPVLFTVMMAMGIIAIFQVMTFFTSNFFEDSGYLMLTLPVRRVTLLASKLVVSLVWFNFMLLAAAISVVIFDAQNISFNFMNLSRDISLQNLVALVEVNIVAALLILTIFFSIAVAQVSYERWRGLAAWAVGLICIGAYFWFFTWIAMRHTYEATVTTERLAPYYGPYGEYTGTFQSFSFMEISHNPVLGANVGRIPIGGYGAFFDIYLYGATLALAIAAFWITSLLLKKHVRL